MKKLIALLLVLTMAFSLMACAAKEETPAEKEEEVRRAKERAEREKLEKAEKERLEKEN